MRAQMWEPMGMRALFILQDADTPPGTIGEAAESAGYTVEIFAARQAVYPDPTAFDLIVPLGSAAMVSDAEHQWWIQPQLAFLKAAHENNIAIFGICFGCQTLSAALGGEVYRLETPEIGWYSAGPSAPPNPILDGPWFEWHFDAVRPPADATILASNETSVQSWQLGRTIAVQFHPEVTVAIVSGWIDSVPADYGTPFGIDLEAVRDATVAMADASRNASFQLFTNVLASLTLKPEPVR